MKMIELCCRKESVFMTKGDITGLIKEDWFLSVLVGSDYFKLEENEKNRIEINEDKNTVLSLIESLRHNTLIVLEGVSLDYMHALGEKWCLPESILIQIEERIKKKEKPQLDVNDVVFLCCNCNAGFKESENTKTSCKSHKTNMYPGSITYSCCGRHHGEEPCVTGYHVLSAGDRELFLKLKHEATE